MPIHQTTIIKINFTYFQKIMLPKVYLCPMKKANIVYLETGTNLGNRLENLTKVNVLINQKVGTIISKSNIYETEAWGLTEQPSFYNQALKVETNLQPLEVLKIILDIEQSAFGRTRNEKWAARMMDIDILLYNQTAIETPELTVPHPHLHQRNFVLIPLMEIAGEILHPILQESIEDLYWKSEDALEVTLVE